MSILMSDDRELFEALKKMGAPDYMRSFRLIVEAGSPVRAEVDCYVERDRNLAPELVSRNYRLVAFDDADLRGKFAEILSPAIDQRAPYARVMLDALVRAVVG